MAFFAVVRPPDQPNFEVVACHINLWSLGGLFFRRVFLWDVGLRLRPSVAGLSKIELAHPFALCQQRIEDLRDHILHPDTARLIFGCPVRVSDSTVAYTTSDGENVELSIGSVPPQNVLFDPHFSDKDCSYCTITFPSALESSRDTYVRVRFEVDRLGRAWMWKPSLFIKTGAVVDLRVSDVREAINREDWKALQPRIVPIACLNLFVIVPAWLQMRAVSPPLHYLRMLEGQVWEPYLGRAVQLGPA